MVIVFGFNFFVYGCKMHTQSHEYLAQIGIQMFIKFFLLLITQMLISHNKLMELGSTDLNWCNHHSTYTEIAYSEPEVFL